jgi:hypothetical protein
MGTALTRFKSLGGSAWKGVSNLATLHWLVAVLGGIIGTTLAIIAGWAWYWVLLLGVGLGLALALAAIQILAMRGAPAASTKTEDTPPLRSDRTVVDGEDNIVHIRNSKVRNHDTFVRGRRNRLSGDNLDIG